MLSRRLFLAAGLSPLLAATPALAERRLKISDLQTDDGPTGAARDLDGAWIRVVGFMAPPLRAHATFFVLSDTPMAVCPYCSGVEDWQPEIVAVYTPRVFDVRPFYEAITVEGRLSLGGRRDPETGFYSMMRVEEAVIR